MKQRNVMIGMLLSGILLCSVCRGDPAVSLHEQLVCPAGTAAVAVDGDLSDVVWTAASEAVRLVRIGLDVPADVPSRMTARFLCDDSALFIAVDATSPGGEPPKGSRNNARHDDQVFNDASVEVFLQPDPSSSDYVHFILNCDNIAYDAKHTARPVEGEINGKDWNPEWQHATRTRVGGWSAEIAIPYTSVTALPPRTGFVWRVKVGHNAPGQPHEMWPRNESTGFHNPDCWASLVMRSPNLLTNGGFEQNDANGRPDGWQFQYHDQEGKGEITLTRTDVPEGRQAVRYEKYDPVMWFPQLWSVPVPIQPHSTYEFSALVDSPKPFVMRYGFFDSDGRRTAKFSRTEPATDGVERRSFTFRIEDEEPRVALGLQYSQVAGVMSIDDVRLVRRNDIEFRRRPLSNPHRYHHLERLAERRPFRSVDRLPEQQDERVILRDSVTDTPIWRITDTPGGSTRHYYMEACPWNCDGSRFLLNRGGLVEFTAGGLENQSLNMRGGWFAWDRQDPDVFFFCRSDGPGSQCLKYSFKTGEETVLRTFEGRVGAWVISWDNRYLLCKQQFDDKPLTERTRVLLVDLRGDNDLVLDPKGHIHQLWFTKLHDYSVEFEYEHHGNYDRGDYQEGNFMMCLDGSIRCIYGGEGVWAGHRAHSPSGEWMCPGGGLQVVNILTGEKRVLGNISSNHQSWETDDSWLAASSGIHMIRFAADRRGFIHRIGSHNSRIGHSTYWAEAHPAMSPDGTKLGYASTMLGDIDFHWMVMMPPGRPEKLIVKSDGKDTVLSWQAPPHAREIGSYLLYEARCSGGPYRALGSSSGPALTATVPAAPGGSPRYYVVTSLERSGLESLPSNEVCSDPAWPGLLSLVYEAEFTPVSEPPAMEAFEARASGMYVLNLGHGRPADRVTFPFLVPRDGTFSIWGLFKNAENAFAGQASIDGRPPVIFNGDAGDWTWLPLAGDVALTAGEHALQLTPSVAFTFIDQFVVTDGAAPAPGPRLLDPVPPAAPANLQVTANNAYSLRLEWQALPPDDVHHVNVYLAEGETCAPDQQNLVASLPVTAPGYTCWGLQAGTRYTNCITAVDRAGNESAPSEPVSVSTGSLDPRWFVAPQVDWRTKGGDCPGLEFATPVRTRAVLWTRWQNLDPKRQGTKGTFEFVLDGRSQGKQPIRFGYICLGHGGPVLGDWLWNHNEPRNEDGSLGFVLEPGSHSLSLRVADDDDLVLGGVILTNDFGFMPADGYTSFLPMSSSK